MATIQQYDVNIKEDAKNSLKNSPSPRRKLVPKYKPLPNNNYDYGDNNFNRLNYDTR